LVFSTMRGSKRITVTLVAALSVGVACTNDYGALDFSGGLLESPGGGRGGTGPTGGGAGGDGGAPDGAAAGAGGFGGSGGLGGNSGRDAAVDAPQGGFGGLPEGGTPDGARDATDAGADASVGGAGPVDAGDDANDASVTPDSGGVDAATDAALDVAPDAATICGATYGATAGYVFCSATPTDCTFAAATQGANCTTVCTAAGGTCLDGNDNGAAPCVVTNAADDCSTARQSTICTCTFP
jgi:hypothetical protein